MANKYEQWVESSQWAEARTLQGEVFAKGRVVAYTDQPTVTLATQDGKRVDWIASLCSAVAEECRAMEGATGIECQRDKGHSGPHKGVHTPNDSIDYPLTVEWPSGDGSWP